MEKCFAEINNNNQVIQVIVVDPKVLPEDASDEDWNAYCQRFSLEDTYWVESFMDNSYRNKSASIGDYYIPNEDIFVDAVWQGKSSIYNAVLDNVTLVLTARLIAPQYENEITYPMFFDNFDSYFKMSVALIAEIPPMHTFVDAGCGFGFTSLIASKLGWDQVIAFDRAIDPAPLNKIVRVNNLNVVFSNYEVNETNQCPSGDAVLLSHFIEEHQMFFDAGFDGPMPKYLLCHGPTDETDLTRLTSMYTSIGYVVDKTLNIDDYTGIVFSYKGGD